MGNKQWVHGFFSGREKGIKIGFKKGLVTGVVITTTAFAALKEYLKK
ncbi:hypothetical protein [Tenacibaculum maritimum]|nr:hypothetical protein [Tenacibaculum maritimum]